MKIPNQPHFGNNPRPQGPKTGHSPLAFEHFQLETIRQSIEKNPLTALNALSEWRTAEEITSKTAVRWSMTQMPLRVWVDSAESQPLVQEKLLFATLRQWEIASEGLIRFRLMDAAIESVENADIQFSWQDETVKGRDYEVGHANRDVQGNRIRKATITLIRKPIIDGHLSPEKQRSRLLATILHEIGHALGLEHSDSAQDVMYYRGWQRETLSANDIHRLKMLYRGAFRSA